MRQQEEEEQEADHTNIKCSHSKKKCERKRDILGIGRKKAIKESTKISFANDHEIPHTGRSPTLFQSRKRLFYRSQNSKNFECLRIHELLINTEVCAVLDLFSNNISSILS
jgi:hypothetical protein